ncbi:hypothetical protein AQUCO_00200034v1 [Aquilegia coerulea]|uniref:Phosphoglycerate mutase family protein n=1 Tax=Aquilegia coerulea TaxID=218851 RepID=A0A2G5F162_AQUCA|nr:hypothetical protein AQUCO_00200034v1 [Aquilegia coerulea]
MSSNSAETTSQRIQNIIVMRHGDRIDNAEPLWIISAKTPWDPPLVHAGKERAFCTGRKLRNTIGFPIHRVIVSPFTRCIQTASQVVSALAAINDDDPLEMTSDKIIIDPSKIKVSVEFGLCEILSKEAIRSEFVPKNGNWGFNISDLEAKFPSGTVDSTVGHVYQEMPKWEESLQDARARYVRVIRALADKFPSENLVLVTHGEGVGVAISAFLKDTSVYEVDYCAYAHLQRQISFSSNKAITAGSFDVVTRNGQSGIGFMPTTAMALDV